METEFASLSYRYGTWGSHTGPPTQAGCCPPAWAVGWRRVILKEAHGKGQSTGGWTAKRWCGGSLSTEPRSPRHRAGTILLQTPALMCSRFLRDSLLRWVIFGTLTLGGQRVDKAILGTSWRSWRGRGRWLSDSNCGLCLPASSWGAGQSSGRPTLIKVSTGQTAFSPELWCQSLGAGGFLNLRVKETSTQLGRAFGGIQPRSGWHWYHVPRVTTLAGTPWCRCPLSEAHRAETLSYVLRWINGIHRNPPHFCEETHSSSFSGTLFKCFHVSHIWKILRLSNFNFPLYN